jgi:hypothetical protein
MIHTAAAIAAFRELGRIFHSGLYPIRAQVAEFHLDENKVANSYMRILKDKVRR